MSFMIPKSQRWFEKNSDVIGPASLTTKCLPQLFTCVFVKIGCVIILVVCISGFLMGDGGNGWGLDGSDSCLCGLKLPSLSLVVLLGGVGGSCILSYPEGRKKMCIINHLNFLQRS